MQSRPDPSTYLTDGKGLWRLERYLTAGEGGGVELEDSVANRIVTVSREVFDGMHLRPVRPLQKGTKGLLGRRR